MNGPLRLAVGSHSKGSGAGCAMNVISWESGDVEITDLPTCADPMLALMVQEVNDTYCTHSTYANARELLCAPCSVDVLALAHRTVGTAMDWSDEEAARTYMQIGFDQVSAFKHDREPIEVTAMVMLQRWLDGEELDYAGLLAVYLRLDAEVVSREAFATKDLFSRLVNINRPGYTSFQRCYSARGAAHLLWPLGTGKPHLAMAHTWIDRFEELTGVKAEPTPEEVTAAAICKMVGV